MKQPWLWVALILLATLGSKQCTPSAPVTLIEKQTSDTVTLTRIDTVVVERPVPVRVVETRTDTLLLYRPQDTIRIPVPIRQYSFRDSLYALDVSGYHVTLDRLEVYPQTVYKTITHTTERTLTNRKRWGIGLQAGYGYHFNTGRLSPYVGIGVQYHLWQF